MKVIELLNKIANDGKIPERIKYNDYEYQYHDKEHGYCRSGYDCIYICLNSEYYLFDILNDEVEIIEEPQEHKIPEKIKIPEKLDYKYENIYHNISKCKHSEIRIIDKINEILDYLEEIE